MCACNYTVCVLILSLCVTILCVGGCAIILSVCVCVCVCECVCVCVCVCVECLSVVVGIPSVCLFC